MQIYPVILSGGAGTRLWPLSRAQYPKQFIRLLDVLDGSLFAATVRRLTAEAGFEAPTIICNDAHRFLVRDELNAIGFPPHRIVVEPVARNTGPAIAVAALSLYEDDADAVLVVMPSDHLIEDDTAFLHAVGQAANIARSGRLVLFGIRPTFPHTGYGYIRRGGSLEGSDDVAFTVDAFHEKPDIETAEKYLAGDRSYWNSGIFVFHVKTLLAELERHAPDVLVAAKQALANATEELGFLRIDQDATAKSPAVSVDCAIMEKTEAAALMPLDAGWSDVGSWSALWDLASQDADGNAINRPDAGLLEDTRDCHIHSERSLIATLGVENLVIVDTPDALLVADKTRAQEVNRIVDRLKAGNRPEHAQHVRVHRPWGYFETLNTGSRFQVKVLHVKPGAKLSMQMHHHRSEHWIVVNGAARVTIGDTEKLLTENESVYVPATQWHRLENSGNIPLKIIEVQTGSYLSEDDIIRAEDIYKRAAQE